MNGFIKNAIQHYKSTLMLFILIFFIGVSSYNSIPKESQPDIEIPYISIDVSFEGISPEDSEKFIVKPLESQLNNVENVIYAESEAGEGYGWVYLKFEAGTDTNIALDNVREAVNIAKSDLPQGADEPIIAELSTASERPVLEFMLSGNVEERVLSNIAEKLKEEINTLQEVLEVDIGGQRKEMIDITISPEKMSLYNLNQSEIATFFSNNNQLIPVGSIENEKGFFSLKISGSIDNTYDILDFPVKVINGTVILFRDVAEIKRIYKDPTSFARINGEKTISFSIKKRTGQNILDTVNKTKSIIEEAKKILPESVHFRYTYDGSKQVKELLSDLENNIISSVFLVFIVILVSLGFRTSLLVAFAIPGSFLMGIIALSLMGISLNMVVLFALIMSIGMLVDGAIVVSEYADKKMQSGLNKKEAYIEASTRMYMPIVSSTATTLAAFIPLLFWPSTTGEFMRYLPLTLIVTLTSSVFMALVFIPTLGSKFGKKYNNKTEIHNLKMIKNSQYEEIKGLEKLYYPLLNFSIKKPIITILSATLLSVIISFAYYHSNEGTIFFPKSNSDSMNILVKLDGDFSLIEKDIFVQEVETKLINNFSQYVDTFYTKTRHSDSTIGRIKLTLVDWQKRPNSSDLAQLIREKFSDTIGYIVEVSESKEGPSNGKDLELSVGSSSSELLNNTVSTLIYEFKKLDYLIDVEDSIPSVGMQWDFSIDRAKAASFGTSSIEIGSMIQMITTGVKIADYRPEDVIDELDVRMRYSKDSRDLNTLNTLMVSTPQGQVPISTFVDQRLIPKVTSIFRMNGMRDVEIKANFIEGVKLSDKIDELQSIIDRVINNNTNIRLDFEGVQEEQNSTSSFLTKAFSIAIFLMFLILLTQFNSFYQTFVVLSAIIFSTMGVIGLLYIIGQPFGIVMGGIGIISLAGIVINNNIVLIDTFNEKMNLYNGDYNKSIIETGLERLRPVFLTTITTILGLLPMALKLNISVFEGSILYNAPSSQFWYQLAYSIIGGMTFAFFITLLVTPALLVVFKKLDLLNYSRKILTQQNHLNKNDLQEAFKKSND